MANITEFTSQIRSLMEQDNLSTAISQLSTFLKESTLLDEAIQQSARYTDVMRQIRLGVVKLEDANVEKAKIRLAILDLLRIMEDNSETPNQQPKAEKPAKEGKTIIQNADKIYNIDHIDNANFS
ncbi:MAG: hypothetical protein ACKVTZ_01215 [Bacteroidia bacterium]